MRVTHVNNMRRTYGVNKRTIMTTIAVVVTACGASVNHVPTVVMMGMTLNILVLDHVTVIAHRKRMQTLAVAGYGNTATK
jgi:hypothetical protein